MRQRRRDSANRRQIRRRCEKLVADLEIPDPFDAHELCANLARQRGRQIYLCAMEMPTDSPCGVWISASNSDYIVYEENTSKLHQGHIILHEIGHLLSNHHHSSSVLGPETSRLLMPSLSPDLVNRVLGRTHYSAGEEQEAELIASLILQRASRWQRPSDWAAPEDSTGIRRRLGGALEHPDDYRHRD